MVICEQRVTYYIVQLLSPRVLESAPPVGGRRPPGIKEGRPWLLLIPPGNLFSICSLLKSFIKSFDHSNHDSLIYPSVDTYKAVLTLYSDGELPNRNLVLVVTKRTTKEEVSKYKFYF